MATTVVPAYSLSRSVAEIIAQKQFMPSLYPEEISRADIVTIGVRIGQWSGLFCKRVSCEVLVSGVAQNAEQERKEETVAKYLQSLFVSCQLPSVDMLTNFLRRDGDIPIERRQAVITVVVPVLHLRQGMVIPVELLLQKEEIEHCKRQGKIV